MKIYVLLSNLIAVVLCFVGPAWSVQVEGAGGNTALGFAAGFTMSYGGSLSSGNQSDTFIGYRAGYFNTASGTANTFVGKDAGLFNSTGTSNTSLGSEAGRDNATGNDNTVTGYQAGLGTGSGNSNFGYQAGGLGTNSVFFGYQAGGTSNGTDNVYIGAGSGSLNHGNHNTFVGRTAGYSGTPGSNSGSDNSFLGYQAGYSNTIGNSNVGLGAEAGFANSEGSANVFVGYRAGYSETTSNRLYIDNCFTKYTLHTGGWCTQPLIFGEFDNRVVQVDGSLSIVTLYTPSDLRYKKDIQPLAASLDKVLHLRGVSYVWDKDTVRGAGYGSERQIGLIAQEVEGVLPELVHTDGAGYKTLSYDKLVPVLIEAVKERQLQMAEKKLIHKQDMAEQQERFARAVAEKDAAILYLRQLLEEIRARLVMLEDSGRTVAAK